MQNKQTTTKKKKNLQENRIHFSTAPSIPSREHFKDHTSFFPSPSQELAYILKNQSPQIV
jgi:hypothetical protein